MVKTRAENKGSEIYFSLPQTERLVFGVVVWVFFFWGGGGVFWFFLMLFCRNSMVVANAFSMLKIVRSF